MIFHKTFISSFSSKLLFLTCLWEKIDTRPSYNNGLILRFEIEMRIVTRAGTILASCKARSLSFAGEFPIGNEKTAKAKNLRNPSWCVCLSVWLGRDIFAHERRTVRLSQMEIESRCCALAVLSFSLLSRLSAGIFRAGVLTIIFERRRRKTSCLQNYTDGGRGEHRRGLHWLETKNENEMKSRNVIIKEGASCCNSFRGA